jgi:RNA polymerase sigma factor (TIGR02999 family)
MMPADTTAEEPTTGIEPVAADALFAKVYARLKAMASRQLASRAGATLHTTALVHELYLRVGRSRDLRFEQLAQFFAYAAHAMRHLLNDRARNRLRLRAGGGWASVTLDSEDARLAIDSAEEALAVEDALIALEQTNPRAARVVELRYLAGLSLEQTADALGLSRPTIDRDWRFARAFLHARLV